MNCTCNNRPSQHANYPNYMYTYHLLYCVPQAGEHDSPKQPWQHSKICSIDCRPCHLTLSTWLRRSWAHTCLLPSSVAIDALECAQIHVHGFCMLVLPGPPILQPPP
jgi:hypothetical protein